MSELKPCPFCGGGAKRFKEYGDERNGYADFVGYRCSDCHVSKGARGDTSKPGYADNSKIEERAIENWNRRSQPEANADAEDAITDTERLNFVLENGVPMMRGGEYRFHGFPGKWFKTDREAIDVAVNAARQSTPTTDAPQAKGSEVRNSDCKGDHE